MSTVYGKFTRSWRRSTVLVKGAVAGDGDVDEVRVADGGRRELRHVHRSKFVAADVHVC